MKLEYRKTRTRVGYLIRQQVCYEAERKVLSELCKNNAYYEPLFVFTNNKGTEIYYDFTSMEQDPESAGKYFNENPQEFWKIVKDFYKEMGDLTFLIKMKNKEDFEEIYRILIKFWAKIALFIALGDLRREIVEKDIAEISYKLRVENDKLIYAATDVLLEIAEQIVPEKLKKWINFLLFEEIVSMSFPSIETLEKRSRGYIYFKGLIYVDENLKKIVEDNNLFIKELETTSRLDNNKEIVGRAASNGTVRGIVRVISEYSQLKNLQKGEIIVTSMTTPDFISYLGKVSAIVTDEGGITSHAAIIAREFDIPTIVGTSNATQILRDGDEIEVNTEEGKVKILKRFI